jgi:cytoskeletal protein CcmA (bactofilin family)
MAVIGRSVTIKGQIFSQEDLTIDGEMEGSVELKEHRLTVGPNGKIQAGIKAREIVVLGTVNGNVEASDKIDIRKEARLVGDIKTSRIVIEDGAYFKGSIDITRAGTAEPPPKPAAAAPSQPRPQQQPQQQPQPQSIAAAQNTGK